MGITWWSTILEAWFEQDNSASTPFQSRRENLESVEILCIAPLQLTNFGVQEKLRSFFGFTRFTRNHGCTHHQFVLIGMVQVHGSHLIAFRRRS
jgi:hypothetical protein